MEAFRLACANGHIDAVKVLWDTGKFKPTYNDMRRVRCIASFILTLQALPYPDLLAYFVKDCKLGSLVDIRLFSTACVKCGM